VVSGRDARGDFTENLEAVARGVRRLEQIQDPILREAVAAALRLSERDLRPDPASRVRMRNTILAALEPGKPTTSDRVYGIFALIGMPAPMLVRLLVVGLIIAGILGGATVASADSLPADTLYAFKLAGEQLRLAIALSVEDRAAVELSIADHRLSEAERLAANGLEDDCIIATASYGSSLADAAADLATVESSDPATAALVTQVQAALTLSQQRVLEIATRLAADPRTAVAAAVLASVSATSAPSKDSPATKIADQAAAITTQLVTLADDRANLADSRRTPAPRATVAPQTDPPTAQPTTSPLGRAVGSTRDAASTPRPAATADPDADEATAADSFVQAPPVNAVAARLAAEKAKEAAHKAALAVEKAKRAAKRTPTPSPTRR
jgi:hypothetical protein